jgi:hypothetical protein
MKLLAAISGEDPGALSRLLIRFGMHVPLLSPPPAAKRMPPLACILSAGVPMCKETEMQRKSKKQTCRSRHRGKNVQSNAALLVMALSELS